MASIRLLSASFLHLQNIVSITGGMDAAESVSGQRQWTRFDPGEILERKGVL